MSETDVTPEAEHADEPATDSERAGEIVALAGGVANVIARASEKLEAGEIVLACHLADWAVAAAPEDKSAHAARMKIYAARAEREESTMAHGIFRSAAVESAAKAGLDAPGDKRSA